MSDEREAENISADRKCAPQEAAANRMCRSQLTEPTACAVITSTAKTMCTHTNDVRHADLQSQVTTGEGPAVDGFGDQKDTMCTAGEVAVGEGSVTNTLCGEGMERRENPPSRTSDVTGDEGD